MNNDFQSIYDLASQQVTYIPGKGQHIADAIRYVLSGPASTLAVRRIEFNGRVLTVKDGDTEDSLLERWNAESKRCPFDELLAENAALRARVAELEAKCGPGSLSGDEAFGFWKVARHNAALEMREAAAQFLDGKAAHHMHDFEKWGVVGNNIVADMLAGFAATIRALPLPGEQADAPTIVNPSPPASP